MSVGGLAGILERVIGGKAADIGPDLLKLGNLGKTGYASGLNIADEGIAGIRRYGDDYERMLKSGRSVLPDSTRSVMARARGLISDRNTRDTAASAARLRQARISSGGRLSAEAAQEYLTEAETEANRNAQEADLGLSTQEAELELGETNNLRSLLTRARESILGAGERRMQLGAGMFNDSLGGRFNRNKAIADTIASTTGGIKTGGGGGGGGGGF